MTATAVAPEAQIDPAPEAPAPPQPLNGVLFAAKREDLRLVKTQKYPRYGPGGQQVGEKPGQTLAFTAGKLFVPNDGPVIMEDGNKLDSTEALEWLRGHRLYDDANGGFFEVKMSAPAVSQAEIDQALQLAARLDVDGMQAMLDAERAGWDRDDVTAPLERSIGEIREALARMEQEAREKAEAEAAAAAKPAPKAAAKS